MLEADFAAIFGEISRGDSPSGSARLGPFPRRRGRLAILCSRPVVILIFGTAFGMDAGWISRFEVSLRTSLTIPARSLTCSYRIDRLWVYVWLYVWAYKRVYKWWC